MFATGNSQIDFVGALVARTDVPWGDIVVFHMDEYVGVGPDHPAGFRRWIRERIAEPARPRAAHYLDGLAPPDQECARYAGLLADHPLDLCCLGSARTGTWPSTTPRWPTSTTRSTCKVVELDAACRRQQVDEGHFATDADVPDRAMTVTIPALLRARTGAGHRARGPQGGAGAAGPRGAGGAGLPGVGSSSAHPHAVVYLDPESAELLPRS